MKGLQKKVDTDRERLPSILWHKSEQLIVILCIWKSMNLMGMIIIYECKTHQSGSGSKIKKNVQEV